MPRTREQLEQAVTEAEGWLDSLDPSSHPAEATDDLRSITAAVRSIAAAEGDLRDAVVRARSNGRSWGRIALALGVSKQAARERFGPST